MRSNREDVVRGIVRLCSFFLVIVKDFECVEKLGDGMSRGGIFYSWGILYIDF